MYANVRNSDVLVRRRIGITTVPATFGPAGDWLNEYCRGRKSSSTDDFRFVRCRFLLPRCYACAAVFLQRPTGIKFLSLFLLSLYTHTHTHTQHTHTHTHTGILGSCAIVNVAAHGRAWVVFLVFQSCWYITLPYRVLTSSSTTYHIVEHALVSVHKHAH